MQPDGKAEGGRVLQRAHQRLGVSGQAIGLAKADATGLGQLRHLGDDFASQANGKRALRVQIGARELTRPVTQHFNQARLVQRRIGIGRADQPRHPGVQGGLQFRVERGAILETGFAHPGRGVDQARDDPLTGGIKRGVGGKAVRRRADGDNLVVLQMQRGRRIMP